MEMRCSFRVILLSGCRISAALSADEIRLPHRLPHPVYPLLLEGVVVSRIESGPDAGSVIVKGDVQLGIDKLSGVMLKLLTEAPPYWSGPAPPLVTTPALEIGERGIWKIQAMIGTVGPMNSPGYGRTWPVIEGRNPEFGEVSAWLRLMANSSERYERQMDVEGRKYPAPQPRAWRAGDAPMRVFTPGAASAAGTHRPLQPAPPVADRPWGMSAAAWLVALIGAVLFGFLTGLGCARRGRGA